MVFLIHTILSSLNFQTFPLTLIIRDPDRSSLLNNFFFKIKWRYDRSKAKYDVHHQRSTQNLRLSQFKNCCYRKVSKPGHSNVFTIPIGGKVTISDGIASGGFCNSPTINKKVNVQFESIQIELFVPELDPEEVKCLDLSLVRSITFQDFMDSLKRIRPSVSPHSLVAYEKWSVQYGELGV